MTNTYRRATTTRKMRARFIGFAFLFSLKFINLDHIVENQLITIIRMIRHNEHEITKNLTLFIWLTNWRRRCPATIVLIAAVGYSELSQYGCISCSSPKFISEFFALERTCPLFMLFCTILRRSVRREFVRSIKFNNHKNFAKLIEVV